MTPRTLISTAALAALGFSASVLPSFADAPPDPISQGRILLDQNDKDHALAVLSDAVAKNPSSVEAYTLLATADLRYGMPDEGLKAAQSAVHLTSAPTDRAAAMFLLGRAQLLVYQEKRLAIVKKYGGSRTGSDVENLQSSHPEEIPEGTPATGSGLGGAGFDPLSSGDSKNAEDAQNENNLGDGSVPDNATNQELSDALDELNRTLGSIEKSFRQTLAADPSYPDAHDGLGLILVVEGKPKDAIAQFQAEVQRDPADIPALAHLAGVQAQEGDLKGAIQSYRRVVRLNPRDQTSYAHLAALYNQQKDSPDEQWAKGMAFLVSGNGSLAEAALTNVKTPTAPILRAQAMLAIASNKPADAQALVERALVLSPTDSDALAMLGDMQANAGKQQDALKTYMSATDSDPSNDAAWYGIGLVQDKLNDPKDAMAAYAKAVAANPNNANARLNLASDQADANMKSEAIANLREYQRRFPTAGNAADVENYIVQLSAS